MINPFTTGYSLLENFQDAVAIPLGEGIVNTIGYEAALRYEVYFE